MLVNLMCFAGAVVLALISIFAFMIWRTEPIPRKQRNPDRTAFYKSIYRNQGRSNR